MTAGGPRRFDALFYAYYLFQAGVPVFPHGLRQTALAWMLFLIVLALDDRCATLG